MSILRSISVRWPVAGRGGRSGVLAVQPGSSPASVPRTRLATGCPLRRRRIGLVKCPQNSEREGAADVVVWARVGDTGDVEADLVNIIKHAADRALQARLNEAGRLRVAGGIFDGRFLHPAVAKPTAWKWMCGPVLAGGQAVVLPLML